MGQKELSILVVGIIITGIGILFSLISFSSASKSANEDAVRQDLASIASSAQAYYIKPSMLGGGGNSFANIDFYHIVFNQISFPYDSIYDDGTNAVNKNGTYHILEKNNSQKPYHIHFNKFINAGNYTLILKTDDNIHDIEIDVNEYN